MSQTLTRREQARVAEKANPPAFQIGDAVNVDGIGEGLEVMAINLGGQGWSIQVRDKTTSRVWVCPLGNVWQS